LGGGRRKPNVNQERRDQRRRLPGMRRRRGEPCLGVERRNGRRRPRKSCHAERWQAAGMDDSRETRTRRRLEAAASLERQGTDLEAIARLER
jgi:hypothetical protein